VNKDAEQLTMFGVPSRHEVAFNVYHVETANTQLADPQAPWGNTQARWSRLTTGEV
jgi:hypothetical protein